MEEGNENVKVATEKKFSGKKTVKYILFLLFGIGTWLNLNGIWIQLPLLIPRLSEGWGLSPQLGLASNIANVGPLIIALIRLIIGQSSAYEVPSICVIFTVGITVPIILSFTWFKQVYFLGKDRSMYLLILGFFLALVNCTSSVTYLPFVNRFKSKWLNIYFAGESLSSLIPAMLGLIQGVGQKAECIPSAKDPTVKIAKHFPPRFSVRIYFICLSIIMFISFVAFLLLWQKQKKMKKKIDAEKVIAGENAQSALLTISNDQVQVETEEKKNEEKFDLKTILYLVVILWTSILLIGCIPSINSYSLNPYGASTFHYVLILCQCCYPLVSLLAWIRPTLFEMSSLGVAISTVVGSLAFFYIFLTAIKSPCSPFVDHWSGQYLVALMWIIVYLVFYFERIALGNYFNKTSGHRGLFWYGLLTQAGAFTGAIFIFLLDYKKFFKERDVCTNYQCS